MAMGNDSIAGYVSVGRARTSALAIALLTGIGVFVACSAVLLDVPTPVSVVIALAVVIAVGWIGLRFLTTWGQFRGQIAAAQKQFQARGNVSDLLRLRLDHEQYGDVRLTIETLLPGDNSARKDLVALVKQLEATHWSINLVRDKAGVDLGQQQLLDSANDFVVAKVGQAYDIDRHNYKGAATENALNKIAQQSEALAQQLLLCKTELVAASGRDSWDEQRQSESQRGIRNVAAVARSLNRDPFGDPDESGERE